MPAVPKLDKELGGKVLLMDDLRSSSEDAVLFRSTAPSGLPSAAESKEPHFHLEVLPRPETDCSKKLKQNH